MEDLLASSDDHFRIICRMRKDMFKKLLHWLRTNTSVRNTRFRVELKLMIFLYIIGSGESQRNAGMFFRIGQTSVNRAFHEVRREMVKLHLDFVVQPDHLYVSGKILSHAKYDPFYVAIGAIDGTHFQAFVPVKDQEKFYKCKGQII
ncbi:hypothetical protein E4U61_007423 [Claviceps capensis]|nr:hypothetical protein E4U61_007423 [Claviceps capensis]